jgi:hypothetical protein
MADTIKRIMFDRVGASTEARITIERDDGSTAQATVDLAGAALTALLAVVATKVAALPAPPTPQQRAAARAAAEARRNAVHAQGAAHRAARNGG